MTGIFPFFYWRPKNTITKPHKYSKHVKLQSTVEAGFSYNTAALVNFGYSEGR